MLRRLAEERFDLLVIGGGISGAGIAQDAAHRGLKVALVEKGDFASGTSHASTKLLHGGLRYLEQFQFRLMYEALHERNRLARLAPHVAEWLPFLIPIYAGGWQQLRIRIGLWLYDLLAGFPKGRTHRRVSRDEALSIAPHLKQDGLHGAYLYFDCRTDDTRLTLDVLGSALEAGAAAANYCQAVELVKEGGRVVGAVVEDRLTGGRQTVRADCVVSAAGPWTDRVLALDAPGPARLSPSKGVHVVVPSRRLPLKGAVLAFSPTGDGRFIFVLPWHGATLLGTTDTPFDDDPDRVTSDEDDVDYILAAANATFPAARLQRSDVISAFAGLRPLIRADAATTAALPREHRIWVSESGLISLAGGKLTTYRTMSAAVIDLVLRRLGRRPVPCRTATIPLGRRRMQALAELARKSPELAQPIAPGLPYTRAEVVHAIQAEMAVFPDDVLARRTRIALLDEGPGDGPRAEIAALLASYGDAARDDAPVFPDAPPFGGAGFIRVGME